MSRISSKDFAEIEKQARLAASAPTPVGGEARGGRRERSGLLVEKMAAAEAKEAAARTFSGGSGGGGGGGNVSAKRKTDRPKRAAAVAAAATAAAAAVSDDDDDEDDGDDDDNSSPMLDRYGASRRRARRRRRINDDDEEDEEQENVMASSADEIEVDDDEAEDADADNELDDAVLAEEARRMVSAQFSPATLIQYAYNGVKAGPGVTVTCDFKPNPDKTKTKQKHKNSLAMTSNDNPKQHWDNWHENIKSEIIAELALLGVKASAPRVRAAWQIVLARHRMSVAKRPGMTTLAHAMAPSWIVTGVAAAAAAASTASSSASSAPIGTMSHYATAVPAVIKRISVFPPRKSDAVYDAIDLAMHARPLGLVDNVVARAKAESRGTAMPYSRKSITGVVDDVYKGVLNKIIEALKLANYPFVSIGSDGVTTVSHEHWQVMTMNWWCSSTQQVRSYVTDVIFFDGNRTAETTAQKMNSRASEWKTRGQISGFMFVGDGANTQQRTQQTLAAMYEEGGALAAMTYIINLNEECEDFTLEQLEERLGGRLSSLSVEDRQKTLSWWCGAHRWQLTLGVAYTYGGGNLFRSDTVDAHGILKKLRNSTELMAVLKRYVRRKGDTLLAIKSADSSVRWNVVGDMLENFVTIADTLLEMKDEGEFNQTQALRLSFPADKLTLQLVRRVKDYVVVLKQLRTWTRVWESDVTPASSHLAQVGAIYYFLKDQEEQSLATVLLKQLLLAAFMHYFSAIWDMPSAFTAAAILSPADASMEYIRDVDLRKKCKALGLTWLKIELARLHPEEVELHETFIKLALKWASAKFTALPTLAPERLDPRLVWDLASRDNNAGSWKLHFVPFACGVLTHPVSSASAERAASVTKLVMTRLRTRLSADNFERLVVCKSFFTKELKTKGDVHEFVWYMLQRGLPSLGNDEAMNIANDVADDVVDALMAL